MTLPGIVGNLLKAATMAALEPEKKTFRVRPGHPGAITRLLRELGHDERKRFASPKGRDAFLLAATRYLTSLPHEELLVAFGSRRGGRRSSGVSLRSVHRTVGQHGSVTPTSYLLGLVDHELEREGAEILLVHNHPDNLVRSALTAVVGSWKPLASDADRQLAQTFLLRRKDHLLTAGRPSSLKWYVVENGRLGEFFLPSADTLLGWLGKAGR